jgi:hypothetical protein
MVKNPNNQKMVITGGWCKWHCFTHIIPRVDDIYIHIYIYIYIYIHYCLKIYIYTMLNYI